MRLRTLLGIVLAVMICAPKAEASSILYQNAFAGAPDGTIGWCSTCVPQNEETFDQFTLGAPASIGQVNFDISSWFGTNWTIRVDITQTDYTTSLYSQTFAPGSYTVVHIPWDGGDQFGSDSVNQVTVDLGGNVTLGAGDYGIGFYDNGSTSQNNDNQTDGLLIPGFLNGPGTQGVTDLTCTPDPQTPGNCVTPSSDPTEDASFTIYGDPVPEPSSLLLLGTGALALMSRVRRKARHTA